MNNEMVSVIVPVYNASSTIERCVDSILQQTYSNVEIILLDDGSKDESLSIIKKLYANEPGVRIFCHNNMGVSYTRNRGLEVSCGQWVMFVDADDYLEPLAIESMMFNRNEYSADVVIGDFFYEKGNDRKSEKFFSVERLTVFEHDEIDKLLRSCLDSKLYGNSESITNVGVPWAKIYNRTCLIEYKFDESLSVMEDMLFNLHVFSRAKRILYYPTPVYHYVGNEGSLSTRKYADFESVAENIISKVNMFAKQRGVSISMNDAIQYKSFCLFYECIRRQHIVDESCKIRRLSREIKRMNERLTLDGTYHSSLKMYYTFPQTIYGILLKQKAYILLATVLIISDKINKLRGK